MSLLTQGGCTDLSSLPLGPKYASLQPANPLKARLLVVFTYGFGCYANGHGNGLRDMAEAVQRAFPDEMVITRGWNDDDGIERTVEQHRGPVILIGHSFGGCRSLEIAEQAKRPIDELVMLDPVPFHDWAIRHEGKHFQLPTNVRNAVCYYRPWGLLPVGYPIVNSSSTRENRPRNWLHNTFCQDPEIRECIIKLCMREASSLY